jgi:hypothetical protein
VPKPNSEFKAKVKEIAESSRHLEEHKREVSERAAKAKEVVYSKGSLAATLED